MPLCFPLMAPINPLRAFGRVTGKGLAPTSRLHFPPTYFERLCCFLLVAIRSHCCRRRGHGRSRATRAPASIATHDGVGCFSERCCSKCSFPIIVRLHLKWLTLSLLAYAAVLFTVQIPWGQVALRTSGPKLTMNRTAPVVVACSALPLVPTSSFWQASEEVETCNAKQSRWAASCVVRLPQTFELRRIRWTPWSGYVLLGHRGFTSSSWPTSVTLPHAGITNIDTAAKAASALRPLAGTSHTFSFAWHFWCRFNRVPVLAGLWRICSLRSDGLELGPERRRRWRVLRHQ